MQSLPLIPPNGNGCNLRHVQVPPSSGCRMIGSIIRKDNRLLIPVAHDGMLAIRLKPSSATRGDFANRRLRRGPHTLRLGGQAQHRPL